MRLKKWAALISVVLLAVITACGNSDEVMSGTDNMMGEVKRQEDGWREDINRSESGLDNNFNILNIEEYDYPKEFALTANLESAIVEMALSFESFDVSNVSDAAYCEYFVSHFCQNSRISYDYLEKIAKENDGLLSEEQVEYIQYSLTNEFVEFKDYIGEKGVNSYKTTSTLGFGKIISYKADDNGNEVKLMAQFEFTGNYLAQMGYSKLYELDIVLVKNSESCFDGYSIRSLTRKDITPVITGDNQQHVFRGMYTGVEDEGVFTFECSGGDDGVIYGAYVKLELSANPELAKFIREHELEEFDVTYILRDDMEQPVVRVVPIDIKIHESQANYDVYVGAYNSYDIDESTLHIQKMEDGTYRIEVGIFRLTTLYCKGNVTDMGLEFFSEFGDTGIITVDDDIATVKITSQNWLEDITEYKYYKTSDIPDIYDFLDF